MRGSRSVLAIALIGVLGAACGGSSPTQAPGAATQNTDGGGGGTATQNPGGGGGGGGGGAGDTSHGKVHIEISGPVTKSADYGFVPAASLFGGDQGASLSFSNGVQNEVVSILINADNTIVVSWGTAEFSAPAAECTTSNWNVGATSGSGSFDCTAALVIMASGATVQNGKVKGSFEARA
ncbi:MAG TPA: hypothetical protein VJ506_08880 [Candidatus Limnocylindrales bacterium]|nr:hypothetical protein [Candidatus Limnocylindrales bacterium]